MQAPEKANNIIALSLKDLSGYQRLENMYRILYDWKMKILKVQTASNLRENLFETLHEVSKGEPQLITHRSGDEVVLISRGYLNQLLEENGVLKAIATGRAEIKAGKGVSQVEVEHRMSAKIDQWRKQK